MTLILHEHPFASYCWKALIALYERDLPFERRFVGDEKDRARLAELWPMTTIPVLVDDAAGITLPESTTIVEYLDGVGDAPALVPADPAEALQARLWDRVIDGHVATPMQKIVGDSLRPEGRGDPEGVAAAHATLERAYALLDTHLTGGGWAAGPAFTLADCAAAPALFYATRRAPLGRAAPRRPDALLHRADGAAFRDARDRRGARVPGDLPAALAGLRAVVALRRFGAAASASRIATVACAPVTSRGSVLRIARLRTKAPSSEQIIPIASLRAAARVRPAAIPRRVAASIQLSKTSEVASRSVSLVLATSSATVAIGQASW